jgi:uncharacterized damage-inducible protein DinB
MNRLALVVCALPLLPALAAAQPASGVSAVRESWREVTAYLTRAAEQMPDANYGYRPVASVRTFGEIIGHVAGAQRMFCAAALGEQLPSEDAVEKSARTKAALIDALKESTTYCERAYALSDAAAAGPATAMFGQQQSRFAVLASNATHNAEHYGNVVTYMRMQGMVPPSSQPASR